MMENDQLTNPYTAGWGLWPPHFAGRQNEMQAIVNAVAKIKGKAGQMEQSPAPALVLVGPRGVGKTVLLQQAIEEADKRGIHSAEIDCNLLSGPVGGLVSQVFPEGFLGKFLDRIDSVKVQLPKVGLAAGLKDAEKVFKKSMEEFLAKEPLLLVLDEAHHCDSDSLNMLFGVVQSCLRSRLPLALILAGTPGLEPLMQRCKATYVERSEFLRFNTLSPDEAKDALAIPAKEAGLPMKPGALKLLHGWADNYPYFIQLVGKHAWYASGQRGGKEITVADAKQALTMADEDRDAFYGKRYSELDDRDLDQYAIQSIKIIQGCKDGNIDVFALRNMLMEANDGMDKKSAKKAVMDMQEEGFLWVRGNQAEPGIPSMFDYVIHKYGTS